MHSTIDVIDLHLSSDEVADLVINSSSTTESVKDSIASGGIWKFDVKATNGELRFQKEIRSSDLAKYKHPMNTKSNHDWELLVYQLFFNDVPQSSKKSTKLSASITEEGNLRLDVILSLGASITQTLGTIEVSQVHDEGDAEEEDDDFDLFEWTRILKDERDNIKEKFDVLEQDKFEIEAQLKKSLESQEELVSQLRAKEQHQLKVFTKILNNFQEFNRKVLNGEITNEPDYFNVEQIRRAIIEVNTAEEEEKRPMQKKRKTTEKSDKMETKPSVPKRKLKKRENRKIVSKDDDDNEEVEEKEQVINESAVEEAEDEEIWTDDEEIKEDRESSPAEKYTSQAVKAESLPSERFAFTHDMNANDAVKQEGDDVAIPDKATETDEDYGEVGASDFEGEEGPRDELAKDTDEDTDAEIDSDDESV